MRFSELMEYFQKKYSLVIVNDFKYGHQQSKYADINLKFKTTESRYTNNLDQSNIKRKNNLEKLLRTGVILKLWRNFKYSKLLFNFKNKDLYNNISKLIVEDNIAAIFVTVPEIYGLYIVDLIKKKEPKIPVIVEVRDIINHSIGKGNPQLAYKKAEKILMRHADGIIALSEGIKDYYSKLTNQKLNIEVIKNGYDHIKFLDCSYNQGLAHKVRLVLAHIGSIYKGRNIKDFIAGLVAFSDATGIEVIFNIVGAIDNQAYNEISDIETPEKVKINVIGTVPHEVAIKYLKECDIAVILTHKHGSDFAIPGKTFEYIGACKPIIAVTEDKELVSLVNGKYGECASHNSNDIKEKLKKILNSQYDFSNRMLYSRETQASKIINYIENIINSNEQ